MRFSQSLFNSKLLRIHLKRGQRNHSVHGVEITARLIKLLQTEDAGPIAAMEPGHCFEFSIVHSHHR